jgi:hypothetical protein
VDFVEELGDTGNVIEIPVDGLGRAEIYRDRIRITLTRVIDRDGTSRERPCVTLVWTREAYLEALKLAEQVGRMVDRPLPRIVHDRARRH